MSIQLLVILALMHGYFAFGKVLDVNTHYESDQLQSFLPQLIENVTYAAAEHYATVYPSSDGLHFLLPVKHNIGEYRLCIDTTMDRTMYFLTETCLNLSIAGCVGKPATTTNFTKIMFYGLDDLGEWDAQIYDASEIDTTMNQRITTLGLMGDLKVANSSLVKLVSFKREKPNDEFGLSRFNQSHGIIGLHPSAWNDNVIPSGFGLDLWQPLLDGSLKTSDEAQNRINTLVKPLNPLNSIQNLHNFGWLKPTNPSRIYYSDSPAPMYADRVSWTLTREPYFYISALRLCGIDVARVNYTSYHTAIIDASATGLGVRQDILQVISAWAPLICETTPFHHCFYNGTLSNNDITSATLPVLSFRIGTSVSEKAIAHETMYLPLKRLLLPLTHSLGTKHPNLHRIAIYAHSSNVQIVFGSLPLSMFYVHVIFEKDNYRRYGFANKIFFEEQTLHGNFSSIPTSAHHPINQLPYTASTFLSTDALDQHGVSLHATMNHQCKPVVVCKGMQSRSILFNTCIIPNCSKYIFFEYNPETQQCELNRAFFIIASVILVIFVLVEVGVLFIEYRSFPAILRFSPQYSAMTPQTQTSSVQRLARLLSRLANPQRERGFLDFDDSSDDDRNMREEEQKSNSMQGANFVHRSRASATLSNSISQSPGGLSSSPAITSPASTSIQASSPAGERGSRRQNRINRAQRVRSGRNQLTIHSDR